jgi:PASTA domain-containing protein
MMIGHADHFQQKVHNIRAGGPDGPDFRYRPISTGSSGRWRRRPGGPRGRWPLVILVALIVGVGSHLSSPITAALSRLSGHSTKSSTPERGTSATSGSSGSSATNRTQVPTPTAAPATPEPAKCPTQPAAGAPTNIALPDVVGQNAKTATEQLQLLGLANVELSSANPAYQMVIVRSNWTVVSTSPAPCTPVKPNDHVVLKVTKPSGGFGNFFDGPLSRFGQPH